MFEQLCAPRTLMATHCSLSAKSDSFTPVWTGSACGYTCHTRAKMNGYVFTKLAIVIQLLPLTATPSISKCPPRSSEATPIKARAGKSLPNWAL
jgi:hypothetical protein